MKTITLTASEIDTLKTHLYLNACNAGCLLNYVHIDCNDVGKNGNYRCKLQRDVHSILNKLGEE